MADAVTIGSDVSKTLKQIETVREKIATGSATDKQLALVVSESIEAVVASSDRIIQLSIEVFYSIVASYSK